MRDQPPAPPPPGAGVPSTGGIFVPATGGPQPPGVPMFPGARVSLPLKLSLLLKMTLSCSQTITGTIPPPEYAEILSLLRVNIRCVVLHWLTVDQFRRHVKLRLPPLTSNVKLCAIWLVSMSGLNAMYMTVIPN